MQLLSGLGSSPIEPLILSLDYLFCLDYRVRKALARLILHSSATNLQSPLCSILESIWNGAAREQFFAFGRQFAIARIRKYN